MRYKGLVCLARVLKPFGKEGEVVVIPETPYFETLEKYKYFYIQYKGEQRKLLIKKVKKMGRRRFIFKFKGIESMEKAKALKGHYLFIEREKLIEPEDKGYYIFDLEGLPVFNENGEKIGVLETILKGKIYDYFVVNDKDGKKIFLPGVKEYIKEIDFENEKIIAHFPEGL
ncbi:MAG: ribosome maturation factor RimM [candidate division WOR-3 bacterium]